MIAATTSAGDWERATRVVRARRRPREQPSDPAALRRLSRHARGGARRDRSMGRCGARARGGARRARTTLPRGRWPNGRSARTPSRPPGAAWVMRARSSQAARSTRQRFTRSQSCGSPKGEPLVAAGLLERAHDNARRDVLLSSRLLVPLVDAYLGCGDVEAPRRERSIGSQETRGALRASARLRALGARAGAGGAGTRRLRARRTTSRERLSTSSAVSGCRTRPPRPASRWRGRSPASSARLRSTRRGRRSRRSATSEHRARRTARRRSCASSASDHRRAPAADQTLTARERQVLDLLAQGMTNAQIGKTLFISEKTAGHHVSRILAKLDVRNRAEAVAHGGGSRWARIGRSNREIGRCARGAARRRLLMSDATARRGGAPSARKGLPP